jgi:serine/threonine protein kinase
VYLATENSTGNKIAIKQIIVNKQVNKQVIVNEVMLMKMCCHSSIVQFLDSYLVSGTLWVAMELIDGEDLTQVIAACKLTETQIAYIIREVPYTEVSSNKGSTYSVILLQHRLWLVWLICTKKALCIEILNLITLWLLLMEELKLVWIDFVFCICIGIF